MATEPNKYYPQASTPLTSGEYDALTLSEAMEAFGVTPETFPTTCQLIGVSTKLEGEAFAKKMLKSYLYFECTQDLGGE